MKKIIYILLLATMLFADMKDFKSGIHTEIVAKLPQILCSQQMYIECYDVDKEGCISLMKLTAESCFKTYEKKMTADLTLDQLGIIGNQIGQCTYLLYDMMLKKSNKVDRECLGKPQWKKSLTNQATHI